MKTNPPKKESLFGIDHRWAIFLWIYTLLTLPIFVYTYIYSWLFEGMVPFQRVTSILLGMTSIFLVSLFFDRLRQKTLKYLTLPYFGLVWTVFSIRLLFEVFSGVDWFTQMTSRDMSQLLNKWNIIDFVRFGDFIVHFLPLMITYHIMHVYKNQIKDTFLGIPRLVRLLLGLSPCPIIFLWYQFYDAHQVYMLSHSVVVDTFKYLAPVVVCLYTTYLFHDLNYPLKKLRTFMKAIRIMAVIAIGIHLVLGVYLFGVHNLWTNGLSWSALLVITMVLIRYRVTHAVEITGNLLLPIYAFVMSSYLLREFIFIAQGGKHTLFISKILPGVFEPTLMYAIYLFLSYITIGPLVGEVLLLEMPYDLKEDTPYKAYLRRHHYIVQEIWQGYGSFILFAFYVAINNDNIRALDPSKNDTSVYLILGCSLLFSFLFSHLHYRRYGKQ